MRRSTAYPQVAALVFLASLIISGPALAQRKNESEKSEADQQLQKLIEARSHEHWGIFETQMLPTLPPRSQPVQALPEWYPSGAVLLTLPDYYIHSFRLNHILGTEEREIVKPDSETTRYVKTAVCNALFDVQTATSNSFRRDLKISKDFDSVCGSVPNSRRAMDVSWGDAKHAEAWWLYLYSRLEDNLIFDDLEPAHVFLKTVKRLTPYVKVVILIHGHDKAGDDALSLWVNYFKNFPEGNKLLEAKDIQFVMVPVKTNWVRDYGPMFVRSVDGQIFCVDARYDTDRVSLEDKRLQSLFESIKRNESVKETELEDRRDDDVSPSFLAERLRQKKGGSLLPNPITVVRPPIDLAGGDFFTDGNGVGFTSTNTLQSNGGNLDLLNLVFKDYFGQKEMVYLRPLPGRTVAHIDMFFKVVNSGIILLGQFGPSNTGSSASMQAEAQRIMDYDLRILTDFYESRGVTVNVMRTETDDFKKGAINVVLVPMPDLLRPDREEFAELEKQLISLKQKREPLAKAVDSALELDESLFSSEEALQDTADGLEETIEQKQTAGPAKPVDLTHLQEVSAQTVSEVRRLYQKYGPKTKAVKWEDNYQQLLELSSILGSEKVGKLGPDERRALSLSLRRAADALLEIISGLETYRIENERAYDENASALAEVDNEISHALEKKTTLQREIPDSIDVYRTFLNALQVKTSQANILFVPSYSNLGAIEKRAQSILRRAYVRAYGDITIVPIDSDYFIKQSGSIHCLTQTLPAELDVFADR